MPDKARARAIFAAAIEAVRPQSLIPRRIQKTAEGFSVEEEDFPLSSEGKLYLFGSGKAVLPMADAIYPILKEKIAGGILVSSYHDACPKGLTLIESCHPYPCQKSLEAGRALLSSFEKMQREDFFIYLLSGGSSALIEVPIEPVTLEEFVLTTQLLLKKSIPIGQINTVRKHLSQIKGGRLARVTAARGVVLAISDVIGDDLEAIGSAPLFKDGTTREDAVSVLQKAGIWEEVPKSVREVLCNPESETPKKERMGISHHIIANNRRALEGAKKAALELGMKVQIVTDTLAGDVCDVADFIMKKIMAASTDKRPLCLLFGGEPTVEVRGSGKGGRNQQLCLLLLEKIRHHPKITFLSGATDGIDGNSEAAGGVVSAEDYASDMHDYLENNDAFHYLKHHDALLMTGPTGTNVMDVMIAIKGA
ncbi:MAG: hypothetical protein B6D59_03710 [Campylobacteraceae bacterium 4484_4]|nr:MAG: hypothetical protein B6D59_03710 [Campylobacteraceae bacterium 4484_4]